MRKKTFQVIACLLAMLIITTGSSSLFSNTEAVNNDPNPIKNSGFEADFDDWVLKDPSNKDIKISTNAYSGKKSLQIVQTQNELSQTVKVRPNTNYDILFYGLYSGPSDGGAIIEVFGEDSEMLLKGIRTPYRFATWFQKTISFDSDDNKLITLVIKNTLGGTVFFDDLVLSPQNNFPNHLKNPGYAAEGLDMWEVRLGGGNDGENQLDFDPTDPWVTTVSDSVEAEGINVIPAPDDLGENMEKSLQFNTNGSRNELYQRATVLQDTEYILSFKYRYSVPGLSVSVLSDAADIPLLYVESLEEQKDTNDEWKTFEKKVNSGKANTLTVAFKDIDTANNVQVIREIKLLRVYSGLSSETLIDPKTGRRIHTIGAQNFITQHGYMTSMDWSSDSKRLVLVAREVMPKEDYYQQQGVKADSTNPVNRPNDIIVHDTVTGTNIFLDHTDSNSGMMDAHDRHYYRSYPRSWTMYSIDINTYERRMIIDQSFTAPISVTNDGSTIGVQLGSSVVETIDTKTREHKEVIRPEFPTEPKYGFNHTIINPIYPNLIQYMHDNAISGGNGDIMDRLWVADANTGQHKLWYQQRDEWSVHHVWEANGMGMFWVNIAGSWTGPNGLMYSPRDGIPNGQWAEVINDDYSYLHVAASPDGRYLVADTQYDKEVDPKGNYKIVLIDLQTRQSELLAQFDFSLKHNSAYHAHPTFSWDSRKVSFNYDVGGALYTAYIDLDEKIVDVTKELN